jgi:hypothetical protein
MSLLDLGKAMDTILNAIAEGHSIKEAAKLAGVSSAAHYHWLKSNQPYQQGYKLAITLRNGILEDVCLKRAIEGYDEVKTTFSLIQDPSTGLVMEVPVEKVVVRKVDNNLASRMLAANDERYNPKSKVEVIDKTSRANILAGARRRLAAAGKLRPDDGKEVRDDWEGTEDE